MGVKRAKKSLNPSNIVLQKYHADTSKRW